jgi:hypothetical protein
LANAARHSASLNAEPKDAGDSTATVRLAVVVACCISCRKSLPGRKSHACSTVVYPAASSWTAIHSAQARLTWV